MGRGGRACEEWVSRGKHVCRGEKCVYMDSGRSKGRNERYAIVPPRPVHTEVCIPMKLQSLESMTLSIPQLK